MKTRLYKDKIPHIKNNFRGKNYFYTTNFSMDERDIFKMEISCLFNLSINKKHFFSSIYISPSRSPYIKHCISVIFSASSLDDIIKDIVDTEFYSDKFKVFYINTEDNTFTYHEKKNIEYLVGMSIKGTADLKEPENILAIAKVDDLWIFGQCESNDYHWQGHKNKPFSYSNALKVELSRSLVNIAAPIGNEKLIDPCCGIGTVLIEALDMKIDIQGYEINKKIYYNAVRNLKYFGFNNVITLNDMKFINNHFHSSIVDIPYGLFTKTTLENQINIIKCARRISDKMVIVTFENMDKYIIDAGFRIKQKCLISKGKFNRFISVWE